VTSKLIFSVSDSEIFDAYMSAPSHFNEGLLLEEGRRRSILYSKYEDRASLARKLSRQVYGYRELQPIEQYFSQIGRADKTASLQIDAPLTQSELKSIAEEFASATEVDEDVTSYLDGPDLVVNTVYTQTDFSRNRFRQRQQREAVVRFEIGPNSTTVTMPATQKGREIVAALRNKIEEARKAEIPVQEVDLSEMPDPSIRTKFFTTLVSEYPNATLSDVLRVKLQASGTATADQSSDEDEEEDGADLGAGLATVEEAVAGVLRGAALSGQDLFGTKIFQELKQRGFFITSITWHSRLQEPGNPVVEFSAEFEEVDECKSFQYAANTWRVRRSTGEYSESFSSTPAAKRTELLGNLQRFAMLTMQSLKAQGGQASVSKDDSGGEGEPS
jgi:hypothetical protein